MEIKRIRSRDLLGNISTELRRSTLHVMDDTRRIATVHNWSRDDNLREINSGSELNTNKIRYQYGNHLDSASLELSGTGQIISYEEYFPYGDTSFMAGTSQKEVKLKEYRYTGKEKDDVTGLYYYGARYYASWLGRWLSADPLFRENPGVYERPKPKDKEEAKKAEAEYLQKLYSEGLNLYWYVKVNPVRFKDSNGRESDRTKLGGAGENEIIKILKSKGYTIFNEGKHPNTVGPDIIAYKDGQIYIIDNKESLKSGKIIYSVKGFESEVRFDKWLQQTRIAIDKASDIDSSIRKEALSALKKGKIRLMITTAGNNIIDIGPGLKKRGINFVRSGNLLSVMNYVGMLTGIARARELYKEYTQIMNDEVPIPKEYVYKVTYLQQRKERINEGALIIAYMIFQDRYRDVYELIDILYNEHLKYIPEELRKPVLM